MGERKASSISRDLLALYRRLFYINLICIWCCIFCMILYIVLPFSFACWHLQIRKRKGMVLGIPMFDENCDSFLELWVCHYINTMPELIWLSTVLTGSTKPIEMTIACKLELLHTWECFRKFSFITWCLIMVWKLTLSLLFFSFSSGFHIFSETDY